MRTALYARVSTNVAQNPEMQLAELRQYCDRRTWTVAGEFVDVGVSGCKERRPQLDSLLASCRKREFDAVVVYRYDRFARSLRQLVNALAEFDSLNIQFVSLHEGVDTSTPNGRLVFGIFATIAEFERELIRERVRSGLAAARNRGKRLGRPRRRLDGDRVAELRAQGRSWREDQPRLRGRGRDSSRRLGEAFGKPRCQRASKAVSLRGNRHLARMCGKQLYSDPSADTSPCAP